MANFNVNIDAEFIKKVTNLGARTDVIVQLMLDDAGQILGDELEKEIRTNHSDTGNLADSIEVHAPYKFNDGTWAVWAYPEGRTAKKMHKGKVYKRSKSGTVSKGRALYNTDLLFFIEYGTSMRGKVRQRARPFLSKMTKRISGKIYKNMQETYDREVKKI